MERIPVESRVISSVGYDPNTRILEVEFKKGGIYHYFDVPEEVHRDFMTTSTHGQYYLANIRDVYSYQRISK